MAQFLRPDTTVTSSTWTFVGASFHGAIQEIAADDAATYVIHTVGGSVTDAIVTLAAATDPASATGHIVYFRYYLDIVAPLAAPNELTVSLYEGAVLVAEDTVSPGAQVWQTSSFTLSAGEANAITDYSALRLKFHYNYGGIGGELWITQAYLEIPDAGVGTGGGTTIDVTSTVVVRPYDRFQHWANQSGAPEMATNYEQTGPEEEEYPWYARPDGYFDGINSKICNRSGLRFPARMTVYVDGNWYGKPFAPDPDPTFGAIDATDYLE